jgi:hypothetical protein
MKSLLKNRRCYGNICDIFPVVHFLLCMHAIDVHVGEFLGVLAAVVLSKAALFCARAPRWQLVLLASSRDPFLVSMQLPFFTFHFLSYYLLHTL